MNQLENLGGAAKQLVHLVHSTFTGLGVAPVPLVIVLGMVSLFAIVGLVVGGTGRRPRGAHRV